MIVAEKYTHVTKLYMWQAKKLLTWNYDIGAAETKENQKGGGIGEGRDLGKWFDL